MRKLLAATAALATLTGTPLFAADMALKAPPPASGARLWLDGLICWRRLWLSGGHRCIGPPVAGFNMNFQPTLWGAGVGLGYRYELANSLVLGLDASAPLWASKPPSRPQLARCHSIRVMRSCLRPKSDTRWGNFYPSLVSALASPTQETELHQPAERPLGPAEIAPLSWRPK